MIPRSFAAGLLTCDWVIFADKAFVGNCFAVDIKIGGTDYVK